MYIGKIIQSIKKEILNWPSVTAEPQIWRPRIRYNNRELGHIHGELLADLPFMMKIRKELVNSYTIYNLDLKRSTLSILT
jgi:Family of unknown function (DUF5519)